ncbi:MAG: hypothetical protein V1659_04240 [Candidatus Woesearchaeota archaeon]
MKSFNKKISADELPKRAEKGRNKPPAKAERAADGRNKVETAR